MSLIFMVAASTIKRMMTCRLNLAGSQPQDDTSLWRKSYCDIYSG